MNRAASTSPADAYEAVMADAGEVPIFLEPPSPDDTWTLVIDLRGVPPWDPPLEWQPEIESDDHRRVVAEFAEDESRPRPPPPPPARGPRAAAHAQEDGHRPAAGVRGMPAPASGRPARGEAGDDSEDDGRATPLDRLGPPCRSAPQSQPSQPRPAALASAHSPAACRPASNVAITWILEMARAGLVTAAELCAAVVQVIVEEKNRRDAGRTLSASPTKALPAPEWQTPPGAARTVGVPVKIVRAMINAKRVSSRLRNVRPNPKQPKYLVNVRELEAVLARDRDSTPEPVCPDNVRELAARIREKASRR